MQIQKDRTETTSQPFMQALIIKKLPLVSLSLWLDSTLVDGSVLFSIYSLGPISDVTADPDVKMKEQSLAKHSSLPV